MPMKKWTVRVHEMAMTEYDVEADSKDSAQILADDYDDLPAELADRVVKRSRDEYRYHLVWPAE